MKIFVGFLARSFFNSAFNPNLPFNFHPVHHQRGLRIFFQLLTLVARVIGEENETALIKILEQHDTRGRSFGPASGQSHGVGIVNAHFNRGGEPTVKLFDRIRIEIGPAQSTSDIFVAKSGVIEWRFLHM